MKKTNVPHLVKDEASNAIINTNIDQYKQILASRQKVKEEKQLKEDIKLLKERIDFLYSYLGIK